MGGPGNGVSLMVYFPYWFDVKRLTIEAGTNKRGGPAPLRLLTLTTGRVQGVPPDGKACILFTLRVQSGRFVRFLGVSCVIIWLCEF